MIHRPVLGLLLLVALGSSPACVSAVGPRDPMGWLEARGADLMDVVSVRVAFGAGLGAYVRATQVLQVGFLFRGPSERSLPRPKGTDLRSVPCVMFGTIGRYGGLWFDSHRELMVPGYSTRDDPQRHWIEREVLAGYLSPQGSLDPWRWSVGGGAHLVLVGAEAEVRPFEVIDFLTGLVGYDPSSDDVPVPPEDPEGAPASLAGS